MVPNYSDRNDISVDNIIFSPNMECFSTNNSVRKGIAVTNMLSIWNISVKNYSARKDISVNNIKPAGIFQ